MEGTISPSGTKVRTKLERTYNGDKTFLESSGDFRLHFLQMLKYLKGAAGKTFAYFLRGSRGQKGRWKEKAGRRGARANSGGA